MAGLTFMDRCLVTQVGPGCLSGGAVGVDGDWEGCPSPSSGHPGTLETPGFYTPRGKTGAGEPVVGRFSKFS